MKMSFDKSSITKGILYLVFIAIIQKANAQNDGVGIGTTTIEPDAILQVEAEDKGMLIPRVTTTARTSLINPSSPGLIVYDSDIRAFYYYDGNSWIRLIASPSKLDLDLNSQKIVNLASGTSSSDAVNKGQLDTKLNLSGGTMTGDINMNGNSILNSPASGSLTGSFPSPTIAANSIGANQLVSGSVGTSELQTDAVTTAKVADLAITSAKIANGSIDATKVSKERNGGVLTTDYVVVSGLTNGWNNTSIFQEPGLMGVFQTNTTPNRPPGTDSNSNMLSIVYQVTSSIRYQVVFVLDNGNLYTRVYNGSWGGWQ
ncbi:pyocin knob domain-containing protein [Marinoscillum sp.]|uniref:pyocin knob domain-containing protein n=1 Tax=Marinoscillum sp. TaxID=2024838 RepID=UPI003BA9D130